MKISAALSLTLAVSSVAVLAQGVLNFANVGSGVDAPVSDWDGTKKLFGPTFAADLYWAPGIVTDSTLLVSLGQPTAFDTNGYFLGGIKTIPNAAAGAVITCQVRVWDYPDGNFWYQTIVSSSPSARVGQSGLFQIMLANSANAAPSLTGLMPFQATELLLDDPRTRPDPVPLTVTQNADALAFTWPSYWKGWTFALQENADLSGTNWRTLTNTPLLTGSQTTILYQIIAPRSSGAMFYRLVQ